MKTLYIDCSMGIAGDMFSAALLGLLDDDGRELAISRLNKAGIPGVDISLEESTKSGIRGWKLRVEVDGTEELAHGEGELGHEPHCHHHAALSDIRTLIEGLELRRRVKDDAIAIYESIAQAEAKVHGTDANLVHFHEVGALDAVADVVAGSYLMSVIGADEVVFSPINVGSGTVECAHGILPVPAPATAELLRGIPMYASEVEGELCTPTGAALTRYFATGFGQMPPMQAEAISYGMGTREYARANCVRAFSGTAYEAKQPKDMKAPDSSPSQIVQLACNIDDMTGEELGYAFETLMNDVSVLDVFATPIQMKKHRPGIMLTVFCPVYAADKVAKLVFELTSTIGIRKYIVDRYVLDRKIDRIDTPLGKVRKKASSGYGVSRSKLEYEDVAQKVQQVKRGE